MTTRTPIQPVDPALQKIHAGLNLDTLILGYPWASEEQAEEATAALESLELDENGQAELREAVAAALHARCTRRQMLNNVTDLLLRAAGIYRRHEEFDDSSIYADVNSIQHGVTTQHWLCALIDLDGRDVDEMSDGYTVTHWHRPTRNRQDFVIMATHKHWWESDRTKYIQLTAYRTDQFESTENRGEPAGSAIVLWPWV